MRDSAWFSALAGLLLCLAGCGSSDLANSELGPEWSVAKDGSVSFISQLQACDIAKQEVEQRERWLEETAIPNHVTHSVSYGARRINKGGWRVIAHSALCENRQDGGGGCAYDPDVPAAVIIIDRRGRVVAYTHSTDPYLDW